MKELELKHLAGYLPYGLKTTSYNGSTINKLDINNLQYIIDKRFKPILRPLSDLTKEEFYHLWSHETDFESIIKFTESDIETIESYKFSLSFWNGIHENHFDIYGLIENNLAIDINTL